MVDRMPHELYLLITGTLGTVVIQLVYVLPTLPAELSGYNELVKTLCQVSVAFTTIFLMVKKHKKDAGANNNSSRD